MNCSKHENANAVAFCRTCGTPLCAECTRPVQETVYCEACLAARIHAAPPQATPVAPDLGANPAAAAVFGFIPGVGAIINGQVLKAFAHVIIFVCLIWVTDHGFDLCGIFIALWIFYMAWDAWATAKARRYGMPLPDPLGLNRVLSELELGRHSAQQPPAAAPTSAQAQQTPYAAPFVAPPTPPVVSYGEPLQAPVAEPAAPSKPGMPMWPVLLIAMGVIFLLDTMGVFSVHAAQLWPAVMILAGVWILIQRFSAGNR